ncbi:MFS transporter [Raineyella sp.]|uniref:MFS transporter n=1 Tax=Raineyella sp. TaxID=1911550 RepID=UPI002B21A3D8|nr:MFS transporter [Raineyella sp.]MEA5153496.1 MFS transporter [Raineyella sp.]
MRGRYGAFRIASRQAVLVALGGAESVSLVGTQVTLVAVPLVAVQQLGASSTTMGLLSAAGWLPIVVFGLLAGAYVDRGRPVWIMVASNMVRLVLISLIPVAYATSMLSVPILLAVVFAAGIGAVFFDVAYQTYLPQTVSRENLATANSRLELSRSVAQLLGPAAAGLLVTALSAPTAVLVDAASFAVAVLLLAPLWRAPEASVVQPRVNQGMVASIREGIGFIRGSAMISLVITAASASNLFTAGAMALQVLFAVQLLGMSPAELGLALTLEGGAALAAAALAPWLTRRIGERGIVFASFCLMTAGAVLLFLAPAYGGLVLFASAQLCFGLSAPLINITLVTMRQRLTPPQLLGRVNAAARVAIMSTLPIGAAGFGAVAGAVGMPTTFLVIAVGLLVVAVAWQVRTPRRAGGAE